MKKTGGSVTHRFVGWEYEGEKGAKLFMRASWAIMHLIRINANLDFGEQKLAFAIIEQAVQDIINLSKSAKFGLIRQEAKTWLLSDEMEELCSLINIKPCFVRFLVKRSLEEIDTTLNQRSSSSLIKTNEAY